MSQTKQRIPCPYSSHRAGWHYLGSLHWTGHTREREIALISDYSALVSLPPTYIVTFSHPHTNQTFLPPPLFLTPSLPLSLQHTYLYVYLSKNFLFPTYISLLFFLPFPTGYFPNTLPQTNRYCSFNFNMSDTYILLLLYSHGPHFYECCLHSQPLTLLASSTAGIGFPFGSSTLLSRSVFHIWTASNVDMRVTSNTTNAPTASL